MTKAQLWLIYVQRNPSFEGRENVTMTPNGLKKLFNQTWELAQQAAKSEKPFDPGIFGDMFRR